MAELQKAEITARIRQARKEAGLTQPEMAELLEVAMRTYQHYEDDRVPWSLMGRISDVSGKSIRWLLHGEEEPSVEGIAELEAKLDRLLEHFGLETISAAIEDAERELGGEADPPVAPARGRQGRPLA